MVLMMMMMRHRLKEVSYCNCYCDEEEAKGENGMVLRGQAAG